MFNSVSSSPLKRPFAIDNTSPPGSPVKRARVDKLELPNLPFPHFKDLTENTNPFSDETKNPNPRAHLAFKGFTYDNPKAYALSKRGVTAKPTSLVQVNYDDESEGKYAYIPGYNSPFLVDFLGKGNYHDVYQFRDNEAISPELSGVNKEPNIIITKQNDFFFVEEGSYRLEDLVLKVKNKLTDQNTRMQQIKAQQLSLNENANPPYRTKTYLYGKDGYSLEQKVTGFEKAMASNQDLFNVGMKFVKTLLEANVKANKTLVFDMKPDNIGFNAMRQPLLIDRDLSDGDFKMDLANDISHWMQYGKVEPDAETKAFRFQYLTENFPEKIQKKCALKIVKKDEERYNQKLYKESKDFEIYIKTLEEQNPTISCDINFIHSLAQRIDNLMNHNPSDWLNYTSLESEKLNQSVKSARFACLTEKFSEQLRLKCTKLISNL